MSRNKDSQIVRRFLETLTKNLEENTEPRIDTKRDLSNILTFQNIELDLDNMEYTWGYILKCKNIFSDGLSNREEIMIYNIKTHNDDSDFITFNIAAVKYITGDTSVLETNKLEKNYVDKIGTGMICKSMKTLKITYNVTTNKKLSHKYSVSRMYEYVNNSWISSGVKDLNNISVNIDNSLQYVADVTPSLSKLQNAVNTVWEVLPAAFLRSSRIDELSVYTSKISNIHFINKKDGEKELTDFFGDNKDLLKYYIDRLKDETAFN